MILIQNGDHRAFSAIYDRYAKRLKSFFYRMLWSDEQMAEDSVQEVFTKLIEKPELYNDQYAFVPWLFRIASNMCKNAYRKQQFEQAFLAQLDTQQVQLPKAEQMLDEQLLMDSLHKTLAVMDEDKRELFLLRYQQELSIKELAQLFEISEGTVKSRLFYIKQQLAKSVKEDQIV